MKITKAGSAAADEVSAEELEALGAFTKRKLGADEVYIFSVLLCDNEIDRDFERFSELALKQLGELFVGVTGICDHEWSTGNQVARIYRTELVTDKGRKNSLGQPYTYLKGWAYILRTEKSAELIAQIEGGIKRETSVGCSVARSVCSVCGEEMGSCSHSKGQKYGGKLCYALLDGAVDAYEWSFVAVPAQKNAGVIKHFEGGLRGLAESDEGRELRKEYETLRLKAELGEKYMGQLRGEVLRLCLVCDENLHTALKSSVHSMDEESLCAMKTALEKKAGELFAPVTQLPGRGEVTAFGGEEYLI